MAGKYQKRPKRIPKLQHHKASGRGVVRLNGKDFYCGEYGTQSCEKEYNRLITEYLAGNPLSVDPTGYTVMELVADYLDFAEKYYRDEEGKVTRSFDRCKETAKILTELYGDTLSREFNAARFKAFKQKLIERGLASTSTNHLLGQARRIFKWGAAEGLLPEQVFRSISLVPNVRKGRHEAPEPEPVHPTGKLSCAKGKNLRRSIFRTNVSCFLSSSEAATWDHPSRSVRRGRQGKATGPAEPASRFFVRPLRVEHGFRQVVFRFEVRRRLG